jgi:hypothetical protein
MSAIHLNYWAILICGIVSMVWGSLYYGPLFGKIYMRLSGLDKLDPAKREEMMKGMGLKYFLAFVGAIVMAFILAHFIIFAEVYMGSYGASVGLTTGFLAWLGLVAPVTMGNVLWGTSSWKFWVFSNFYYLVQLLAFGIILGHLR